MALITDVHTLEQVASVWGNKIRDQGVAVFVSTAERSAQLAIPTDGRMAFVADINQLFVGIDGAWRPVAHDVCPSGMTIGGVQIGSKTGVAGAEGGQINLLAAPDDNASWSIDVYQDRLRFFTGSTVVLDLGISTGVRAARKLVALQGAQVDNGLTVTGGTVSLTANTTSDVVLQTTNGSADILLKAPHINFRSLTNNVMMTMRESPVGKTDINMDLPDLTTGDLVCITPGGQLGRSSHPAALLASLGVQPMAMGTAEDVGARLDAIEARLDALEAKVG